MIKTVDAYKLRTNLGSYLDEVFYKERDIIILRKGKPMVKMTPIKPSLSKTYPSIKGMFSGISVTEADIEQAKRTMFPYA
jgi:antitoxin (DNA-binding transcriptional repressor) of toxin-antitoxin stability system